MRSTCLSTAALFLTIGMAVADQENNIFAIVNDDIITVGEIYKLAAPTLERLRRASSEQEFKARARAVYKQYGDRLINQRLLVQEGRRMIAAQEIEPRWIDRSLDAHIKDLIAQAGSLLQLKKMLAKGGETLEEKKERTRDEILIQMVHHKHVRSRVSVSPRDVRDFYLKHVADYTRVKEVKSRHIFVPLTAHGSGEKTRAFVASLLTKLHEGADFATLARKHSKGPHAADGGLWDFMKRPAFGGQVDEAMFSLGQGEISPIIDTAKGYQVLQVVDIRPGGKVPFEEVVEEIQNRLKTERLNKRFQEFIAELRSKAYIKYR